VFFLDGVGRYAGLIRTPEVAEGCSFRLATLQQYAKCSLPSSSAPAPVAA